MTEYLKWEEIVALIDAGEFPEILIERWRIQNGTDIDDRIATWKTGGRVMTHRLKPLRYLSSWFGLFVYVGIVWLVFIDAKDWSPRVIAGTAVIALSSFLWVVTLFFRKHYWRQTNKSWECYEFVAAVNLFREWIGSDISRLNNFSPQELVQIATGIVATAAAKVLSYQSKSPHDPDLDGYVDEDKRHLMDEFQQKHDTLRDMGLLQKVGYGPYFKVARELLAAEKN